MYLRIVRLVLAIFLACLCVRAADDPLMGTWKLNVAKSHYDPGPPPKSLIRIHEPSGKGIKVTSNAVAQDGKPVHFEFTANFDGKYYPVTGNGNRDEMTLKRIDAYTVETTNRNQGKETTRSRWVISKNGKTFTNTIEGVFPDGRTVHNVHVYDKQ